MAEAAEEADRARAAPEGVRGSGLLRPVRITKHTLEAIGGLYTAPREQLGALPDGRKGVRARTSGRPAPAAVWRSVGWQLLAKQISRRVRGVHYQFTWESQTACPVRQSALARPPLVLRPDNLVAAMWAQFAFGVQTGQEARPPRVPTPEVRIPTDDQLICFSRHAREDRFYCLYLLAAFTGMRQGELLALQWSDIHFEQRCLYVRRTVWYYARAKRYVFSEPKSENARRRVDLVDAVIGALHRRQEEQRAQRLTAGDAWEDTGDLLAFTDECGRPLLPHRSSRHSYKRTLQAAGLPDVDFHALRRSFATAPLPEGEHVKLVSELLGH